MAASSNNDSPCSDQGRLPDGIYELSPSDSLLDVVLRGTFYEVVWYLRGRKYRTENLHPRATLALFEGTRARLTEDDLLDLLGVKKADSAHDFAKHLRSRTAVRSKKLFYLHSHALNLLRSRKVDNAEVVRGWVYALIHAAVLEVLHDARDEQLEATRTCAPIAELLLDGWVHEAHSKLMALVQSHVDKALAADRAGRRDIKPDVFLQTSSYGVLATMARAAPPFQTLKVLLDDIYPEINRLGDPMALGHAFATWIRWAMALGRPAMP